jgi:hypothetical protein
MATLSPPPKLQFFDANGVPLAGGKLYSYAAGTTTPLATYTSAAETTFNTNPLILNSRGEAEAWLGSLLYKFKLTTAADVEIWTVDNISSSAELKAYFAASAGASRVGFIGAGAGAVARTAEAKMRDFVSVKDFGANGDGVTDATAAFQAAIDFATTGGNSVYVPPGIYQISSITLKDGVTLMGACSYACVLRGTTAFGTIINMQVSAQIFNLKFTSSVLRTSGYFLDMQKNGCVVHQCEFDSYFIAVNAGAAADPLVVAPRVSECIFREPAPVNGAGGVQFIHFSNAIFRNIIMTGLGFSNQAFFGVRFQQGDTAFVSGVNITLHGIGLLVDTPALLNIYGLTIADSYFDSSGTILGGGAVATAEFTPAGGVYNTRISNTWFGLAQSKAGCFMQGVGVGVVDGIVFTGCEFTDNGDSGLLAVGTGIKNWSVVGGHSGGNTNAGIRAANGTSDFLISGHMAGAIAGRGANAKGITVDATPSNNYVIDGCFVVGNTTFSIEDLGTGSNARVTNNLGYNGVTNVSALTVGASPWSYTAGHTPENIYVSGGTVSEIRIDGQIIFVSTGATVPLAPNQTMQITYSSLPVVFRKLV